MTARTTRHGWGMAWIVAGLIAALSFAGSAGAQTHAIPADVARIYELEGYSVLPPPGKNWFEMGSDRQQVLFGKKIESRTHSFAATATSGLIGEKFETREQFQAYVNQMRVADLGSDRYKVVEFSSDFDPAFLAWCVRYRSKTQDRDAPFALGRVLLLEHFGVTCLHPTIADLVVDVGYSERGRPAEISAELRAEGESFMRSLKFTGRQ
jgi:hypothetical protein